MVSRRRFLYEWYPETYEESHRWRPTYFSGPCIAAVNAYYNPSSFDDYRSFVEALLNALHFKNAENNSELIAAHFTDKIDPSKEEPRQTSAPLVYDSFERPAPYGGKWRLEFHGEYVSISLYIPIDFRIPKTSDALCIDVASQEMSRIPLNSPTFGETLFDFLYKEMQTHVDAELDKLADALHGWCSRGAGIPKTSEPKLFADFFGAIVPWSCFAPCTPTESHPQFPDVAAKGLPAAAVEPFGSSAAEFLHHLWDRGLSNSLLGSSKDDCVACFMQDGHSIYVSNLGKRSGALDLSPLKYLVMYSNQPEAVPAYFQRKKRRVKPADALEIRTNDNELQSSWRLCRFVGRLHDLGIIRLAALRNINRMKKFNYFLSDMEYRVQEINTTIEGSRVLGSYDVEIHNKAALVGESVYHRSLRASHYLDRMKGIIDDIGVIGIPGFQDYRQFVRRYLFQSAGSIAAVGPRYRRLMEQMGSKHGIANSVNLLNIQRIADAAASVVILYYVSRIPLTLGEYVERTKIKENAPVEIYFVGLVTTFIVFLALSQRVYRAVREVRKDRVGIPSVAILLAYLFAMPFIILDRVLKPISGYIVRLFRSEQSKGP